jgi:hypothetical protein
MKTYETRDRKLQPTPGGYETRERQRPESTLQSIGRQAENIPSQLVGMLGIPGHYIQKNAPESLPTREETQNAVRDYEQIPLMDKLFKSRGFAGSPLMQSLHALPTPSEVRKSIDPLLGKFGLPVDTQQNERSGDLGPYIAGVLPATVGGAMLGGPAGALAGAGIGAAAMAGSHITGKIGRSAGELINKPELGETIGELLGLYAGPKAINEGYAYGKNKTINRPSSVLPPEIIKAAEAERLSQEKVYPHQKQAIKEEYIPKIEEIETKAAEEARNIEREYLGKKEKIVSEINELEESANKSYNKVEETLKEIPKDKEYIEASALRELIDSSYEDATFGVPKEQVAKIYDLLDSYTSIFKGGKNNESF